MYIYDRQLSALRPRGIEQPVILRPSQPCYYPYQAAFVTERYALGQDVSSLASYNTPGVTFDPQSDYILAPEVMDAVEKLLSTRVPDAHLRDLGSNVNALMVERGLTIFRYDDGRLQEGQVIFGAKPRKETTSGSITSGGSIRYSVELDVGPWTSIDATTGKVMSQARPWLFIHTHPNVNTVPEVPSGIRQENSLRSGDLYSLRRESDHQIGIMTIGVNSEIANFRSAPQTIPIPFTLALRDPIKGPASYRATVLLETHKAAATALRSMFPRPTVSGYYTGDLRTGRATPYLSARQQRKMTTKDGA
jgi:hypothetical protein